MSAAKAKRVLNGMMYREKTVDLDGGSFKQNGRLLFGTEAAMAPC